MLKKFGTWIGLTLTVGIISALLMSAFGITFPSTLGIVLYSGLWASYGVLAAYIVKKT